MLFKRKPWAARSNDNSVGNKIDLRIAETILRTKRWTPAITAQEGAEAHILAACGRASPPPPRALGTGMARRGISMAGQRDCTTAIPAARARAAASSSRSPSCVHTAPALQPCHRSEIDSRTAVRRALGSVTESDARRHYMNCHRRHRQRHVTHPAWMASSTTGPIRSERRKMSTRSTFSGMSLTLATAGTPRILSPRAAAFSLTGMHRYP